VDTDDILNDPHLLARELSAGSRLKMPITPFHMQAEKPKPTPDDDDDWDIEPQLMRKPKPKREESDDNEFGQPVSKSDNQFRTSKCKKTKTLENSRKRMPNGMQRPHAAVKIDTLAERNDKRRSDIMRR
jgi:hypothetical protein